MRKNITHVDNIYLIFKTLLLFLTLVRQYNIGLHDRHSFVKFYAIDYSQKVIFGDS